ncbi:oligosaccharide flippase family protein [Candidatus Latescibacterota bacterium]
MFESKDYGNRAAVVGTGRSLYVASIFIMNVGLARSMGTETFGSFQQVFMFSALFIIVTLGIPETMYFFLPRLTEEERPRFLGQTLIILAACSIFIALVFWFGASYFAELQHNPAIEPQLRIFGIYGAFLIASAFIDPVFITFKRLHYLFTLSVLHALFFFGLTLWHYFGESTTYMLFEAMAVFGLCKYILSLVLLFRMHSETGRIHLFRGKSMILLQLSFSLPVALSNAIDIISRWLDKFVVSIFFGTQVLGVYYVGAIEIPFIAVVVSSIYSVLSPVLNQLHHQDDRGGFVKLVAKTFKLSSKIIWPIFIYLYVFADHIIPFVFKSEFRGAVEPFRIYLLLMPLRIASYGGIVLALGRSRTVFWSAFASLSVNFILNIVLALKMGFIGPAVATVVSTVFHISVLLYIIVKELNVMLDQLIPFKFLFSVGITCVLAVIFAFGFTVGFVDDGRTILFSLPIFFGAYLFFGSWAGFIKISDIRDFWRGIFHGTKSDSE